MQPRKSYEEMHQFFDQAYFEIFINCFEKLIPKREPKLTLQVVLTRKSFRNYKSYFLFELNTRHEVLSSQYEA